MWSSNSQPQDQESYAPPTDLARGPCGFISFRRIHFLFNFSPRIIFQFYFFLNCLLKIYFHVSLALNIKVAPKKENSVWISSNLQWLARGPIGFDMLTILMPYVPSIQRIKCSKDLERQNATNKQWIFKWKGTPNLNEGHVKSKNDYYFHHQGISQTLFQLRTYFIFE